MSRYIDADAFKEELKENYTFYGFVDLLKDFYVAIDDAPSIDIVRCRECKHREEYPCKVYHDDDWYCADGEREGER